jgi:hypothetical protein
MTAPYSRQTKVDYSGDLNYCVLDDDDEQGEHDDWEPILVDSGDSDSEESEEESGSVTSDTELDEAKASADPYVQQHRAETASSTTRTLRWKLYVLLFLSLLLTLAVACISFPIAAFDDGLESLYVPGLGFSGFWFALGRLKSIPDKASKHYVCFSAGCLGTVAILNDFSVEEMACTAQTLQNQWKQGHIDRFQVVTRFVDGLVYRKFDGCIAENDSHSVPIDNTNLLSKVHILTTELSATGPQATMRSPSNLEELREMLVQTVWM